MDLSARPLRRVCSACAAGAGAAAAGRWRQRARQRAKGVVLVAEAEPAGHRELVPVPSEAAGWGQPTAATAGSDVVSRRMTP